MGERAFEGGEGEKVDWKRDCENFFSLTFLNIFSRPFNERAVICLAIAGGVYERRLFLEESSSSI